MKQVFQDIVDKKLSMFGNINGITSELTSHLQEKEGKKMFIAKIKLSNVSEHQKHFNYCFPNIHIPSNPQMQYIVPTAASAILTQNQTFTANYGGIMPFGFVAVRQPNTSQCLLFSVLDKKGSFKEFKFSKEKDSIRFSALYYQIILAPGSSVQLPQCVVVYFQSLDFIVNTCQIYQQISKSWFNHYTPSFGQFKNSFILRVLELYQIQWHASQRRVKDTLNIMLTQLLKQDQQKIGPIGYVHLRDWSCENQQLSSKFGNYLKENLVGNSITKQWLREQIRVLQQIKNVAVGLYVEGYLVSKGLFTNSPQLLCQLQSMEMRDENNNPYKVWGSHNLTLCNSFQKWRNLLIQKLDNLLDYLEVQAIYNYSHYQQNFINHKLKNQNELLKFSNKIKDFIIKFIA